MEFFWQAEKPEKGQRPSPYRLTYCSTLFEPRDRASFWSCVETGGGPKIMLMDVRAGEWTEQMKKDPSATTRSPANGFNDPTI
jgi:hypothetical protein